jgi:integrase
MKPLVSPIASQIERFLQFKRAVGCHYRDEERQLEVLDRFLASRLPSGDPVITDSIIRSYVKRSSHRLTILRQLCRFIALEEPRTFIPPPHFLGISRRPFVPRILTREEGRAFLKACLDLPSGRCSPLRGMVHGTALALLYLTGMRGGGGIVLEPRRCRLIQRGNKDQTRQVRKVEVRAHGARPHGPHGTVQALCGSVFGHTPSECLLLPRPERLPVHQGCFTILVPNSPD